MVTLLYRGIEGIHVDMYDFPLCFHTAKIRDFRGNRKSTGMLSAGKVASGLFSASGRAAFSAVLRFYPFDILSKCQTQAARFAYLRAEGQSVENARCSRAGAGTTCQRKTAFA